MKKILFINACVRPNSRTRDLTKSVLEKLSGSVEEVKLYEQDLSPLDLKGMEERDLAHKNKDFSSSTFALARQFKSADSIVIATPYWDLSFPAVVKSYFEKVTVNGLTFAYGEDGRPYGLCKAKRLIYVTTAGGPIIYNFGYDYVTALAKNFYGINQVQCIKAETLDVKGSNATEILQNAKSSINIEK